MQTRRDFLMRATSSAFLTTVASRTWAEPEPPQSRLVARQASVQLAPSAYPQTEIWGYDGTMPGPLIRVRQGGRVVRRLLNDLPQATSLHWHGLRIDNAMDGVPGLTQQAVATGASFDIDFVAPDAGTYWYHAHNRSMEQVARGLYGALVVEEPERPDVDRDEVLILDDWLLNQDTAQIDADFSRSHDRSHAGRLGNFIATNGQYDHSLDVRRHERLRLRLVNAANARIFELALSGLNGWVMALDGMPLERPQPLSDTVLLGPGQRADLFVDVVAEEGKTAYLVRVDNGEGFVQSAFPVMPGSSNARVNMPDPLPPNPDMGAPDLAQARRLRLHMGGGAMGRLRSAVLDGERRTFREMAEANQFWAFNDMIGMTDAPLAELSLGEPVRLEIVNDTAFPHAMHLHGMHFHEIATDGTLGPLRDTLLSYGGQTREIAFVAHNPGDWLFHCHMLSHAESGMMTWMRVV
ncbi:multicopper oxidase family protein [Boseongicola sp. H5]|uniref:multicopper oxidase family protein n=1 Tax=Boseongicola sp. H5 TaxID=2763261 RepID=UPI001D0A4F2C|nr:multicopper oxidase family protein [Boseongicola sp. H5]